MSCQYRKVNDMLKAVFTPNEEPIQFFSFILVAYSLICSAFTFKAEICLTKILDICADRSDCVTTFILELKFLCYKLRNYYVQFTMNKLPIGVKLFIILFKFAQLVNFYLVLIEGKLSLIFPTGCPFQVTMESMILRQLSQTVSFLIDSFCV